MAFSKLYFFADDHYWRYSIAADAAEPGWPRKIERGWRLLPQPIGDVLNLGNGKVYFFSGKEYRRFDTSLARVDVGPLRIADQWRWPPRGRVFPSSRSTTATPEPTVHAGVSSMRSSANRQWASALLFLVSSTLIGGCRHESRVADLDLAALARQERSTCQSSRTYEAESMSHSTGGATVDGWNIWSNGHISTSHTFAAGLTTLKVTARGTVAAGVWPKMTVAVGGTWIGSVSVNTPTYKEYSFTYDATVGSREIRVSFTNDFASGNEDRNLLVDKVAVGCPAGAAPDSCSRAPGFVVETPLVLDKSTVHAGEKLTGIATYRNCSSEAVSVQQLVIASRPPGGTHGGGPFADFIPVQGASVVQPGDTVTVTASRDFTSSDPAGQWVSFVTYQDLDGTWHDGPDVSFTAQTGSASLPGTYTTGVPFRGINRAGLDYGDEWLGWTGQTFYEIPTASQTASELAYFRSKGFNTIRLPISWERLQHTLNGPLTPSYVSGMMAYINAATSAGFYVILDLHNYNRYAENTHNPSGVQVPGYIQRVMGDGFLTIAHLADVWVKLTNLVLANHKVILNLMNESHDFPMTSTQWFAGVQTVMDAIRATGSTHLILVPNSRSSDVDHWSTYAPNGGPLDSVAALAIHDSANNYAFDMHAYQNNPSSSSSYANLVSTVTNWAKTNKKKLFLSEMGAVADAANGSNGIGGLLTYLNSNNDVWLGWTPWDLSPYSLTSEAHTADAPAISWYTPFLVPNIIGNPEP